MSLTPRLLLASDTAVSATKYSEMAHFKKRIKRKQKFLKEGLDSFLNSAMNIEFVYIIMLGINNFMESSHNAQVEDEVNKHFFRMGHHRHGSLGSIPKKDKDPAEEEMSQD